MSPHSRHLPDSRYAWTRLAITLVLISLGSSTMYVVPVVFPAVQADFGVDRAAVSASYAMLMVGMGVGGINYEADYHAESLATAGVRYHF